MTLDVNTLKAPIVTKKTAPRSTKSYTVGSSLTTSQIGLKHHYAVTGDYNLALLDQLLANREMKQIYCSNELNCGFSAPSSLHRVIDLDSKAVAARAAVATSIAASLIYINAIPLLAREDPPSVSVQ